MPYITFKENLETKVHLWKEHIQEYLEEELGPLPEFEYGEKSEFFNKFEDTPWRISFSNNKPLYVISATNIDKWFFEGLLSDKAHIKEYSLGNLIFTLVHDHIHLYQINLLMKKPSFIKNWLIKSSTHHYWIEGMAQLYTFKICNRMIGGAKVEDLNSINKDNLEKKVLQLLEFREYKNSLAYVLASYLSKDTILLRGMGKIKEDAFSFNGYCFQFDNEVIRIAQNKEFLDVYKNKISECKKRELKRYYPYLFGAYMCAKLISNGLYTMDALISTPLSNKEIKNIEVQNDI